MTWRRVLASLRYRWRRPPPSDSSSRSASHPSDRRAVHRCSRSSPTSCGSERPGNSVLARAQRPTDMAQAAQCERARAATQTGPATAGYPQRTYSELRAGTDSKLGWRLRPFLRARANRPRTPLQEAPVAAAAQPPPAPGPPPGTSLVGWVTGPDSPNHTIRHSRSPGPTSGSCGTTAIPSTSGADGVRRHERLLRRPRQAMALQHVVPHPGRRAGQDDRRAEWRGPNSTPAHRCGRRAFPSRSSTASGWRQRKRESSRPQASPSGAPNT